MRWFPAKIEEQFCAIRQCMPPSEACYTDARYINNPALETTVFKQARYMYREQREAITDHVEFIINPCGIVMQTVPLGALSRHEESGRVRL